MRWFWEIFGRWRPAVGGRGWQGERLAEDFLRREHRFRILHRNWRNPLNRREEIDLVALDGEVLVFVEVKARAAGALVSGYHAVNPRKRRALRRAIRAYLAGVVPRPVTIRFDIVEVELGDPDVVRHFANCPMFGRYFH